MTKDLLQGTQARRLVRQPEGWTLEVECLVRRYGSVYRPSVRRIQGMDVILHHLHAVRAERLAEHARRLMDEVKTDDAREHSFEPVNDEWIPSSLLQSNPPAFNAVEDPKLTEKLAELDRENRNLRARLAQIESMISSDVEHAEESLNGAPSPVARRLSEAPPANEQSSDKSPLAYQGTMVLQNGRADLRKPIPLEPLDPASDVKDENAGHAANDEMAWDQDDAPPLYEAAADDLDAAEPAPAVSSPPSYDPTEGAEDDDLPGADASAADQDSEPST